MSYKVFSTFLLENKSGDPQILSKGALLTDHNSSKKYLQLNLKNDTKNIIKQVSIEVKCLDESSGYVGTQSYTYQNMFVIQGSEFGEQVPISLNFEDIYSVNVSVTDIQYMQTATKKEQIVKKTRVSFNAHCIENANLYNKFFVRLAIITFLLCFLIDFLDIVAGLNLMQSFINSEILCYISDNWECIIKCVS